MKSGILGAAALGLGLALAVAGPDLPKLGNSLLGVENDDGLGAITLHFQTHDALREGRLSLVDTDQFVPVGRDRVRLDGGNSLEFFVSGILRLFLPWPSWLAAAQLAWIPLNLLAFIPLGRHLWGRWSPTLAAGAAFALYGPLLGQIALGRLTQVVLLGLPLAVLGLLRVAEEGGRKAWVQAGLGMALTGLGYWFYALFLGLVAPLFALWGLRHRPARDLSLDLGRGALLALGLVSPLLLWIVWPALSGGWMPDPPVSAEFSSPVFPDALPLSGPVPTHARGWWPWALALGAGVTLWRGQRRLLWGGSLILCLLGALGPAQTLGGTTWLLPYYPLWRYLPGLDRMLHPERWLALAGLFFVVLAADGLARWRPRLCWLLPLGVFVQHHVQGVLPMGTWGYLAPHVWEELAQGPEGAAVVLPLFDAPRAVPALPFHGRGMLGGMGESIPMFLPPELRGFVEDNTLLSGMLALSRGQQAELSVYQEDLDALRAAGFSQIVLDKDSQARSPRARNMDLAGKLRLALGAPRYEGADGAIWTLPRSGRPGQAPPSGVKVLEMGPAGPDPKAGRP